MAVLVVLLTIYLIWGNMSKNYKFILFVLDLLFLFNLIFTKTRGAWLGFLAAIVVLGFLKSKKVLFIAMICLLIIFISLPNIYTERFISSFNIEYNLKTNSSNATRIGLWYSAIKMFIDNPINGVGYDQYRNAYIDEYKIEGIPPFSHSHNNLLNYAAELGLLGLVSFFYLMYVVLKNLIIYYKIIENTNYKLFYLGGILVFVIYNVQGLTEYNFGDTEPLHFFWFFIAISFVISKFKINNSNSIE
jgi:O-antigen ligase